MQLILICDACVGLFVLSLLQCTAFEARWLYDVRVVLQKSPTPLMDVEQLEWAKRNVNAVETLPKTIGSLTDTVHDVPHYNLLKQSL